MKPPFTFLSYTILLLFILLALPAFALELTGRVVGVSDGDTITILAEGDTQHKIRLYGIDAPESGQAFGQRSKQLLSSLLYQDTVRVTYTSKDHYGRIIGKVYNSDLYINAEMIRLGLAWHYKQYSSDPDLAALEDEARTAKRGLWAQNPVPPWEYRRNPKAAPDKDSTSPAYWITTGSKTIHNSTCKHYRTTNPEGKNCTLCGGKE